MLIDLNGTYIETSHVIAVREVSKHKTNVWCVGQSAVDGAFLIDMPVEEVIEMLNVTQARAFAAELMEDMDAEEDEEVEAP